MKNLLKKLHTTLSNGVLFLLPIILVVYLLKIAFEFLFRLAKPISDRLPDVLLQFDGSGIITAIILVLICFLGGLIYQSRHIQRWILAIEEYVLSYVPGYFLIKNVAADVVGSTEEHNLKPILVQEEDSYSIGFLVEETDGWSTVWLPETPKQDSGNVVIVPSEKVILLNANTFQLRHSLKMYGKGVNKWHKLK